MHRHVAERLASVGRALLYLAFFSTAFMRPQLRVASLAAIPTDAIMVMAGACWAAAAAADRRYCRWDRLFVALAVYFGTMVAAALFSGMPIVRGAARLAGEAYLLSLPVVVSGLMRGDRHVGTACRAWLAGTAVIVVMLAVALATAAVDPAASWLGLVQHHLGSLPLGGLVRYKLAYDNPNMLGAYLAASLALALLCAERGWIGRGWTGKGGSIALIAGIAMALVATFSAGIGGASCSGRPGSG